MNRVTLLPIIFIAVAVLVVLFSTLFMVHQTQYALVVQLGEIKKVIDKPGVKVKLPFVQNVEFLDKRILPLDTPPEEVIAADRKRLVVDAFARYRIIDPSTYYRALGTESTARARLEQYLTSEVRNTLGAQSFSAVLSEKRADLMLTIRDKVNAEARNLGIEIVDVRIRRADLPEENSQAIYRRMQTERQQQASEIRAEGTEEALRIRARADRDVTVLLAEARRDADILRGQGDAERNRIFAEAYGKDPDFFAFYRSMQAYEEALKKDDTTFVLAPSSPFFRYFGSADGR
jgi:membrane protease subunit HflC